jgi:hypothetical protein
LILASNVLWGWIRRDGFHGIKLLLTFLFNLIITNPHRITEDSWGRKNMSKSETIVAQSYEQDLTHIASAIEGIRYGSIEITIHDSRIVQIERKEKLRFDRER